MSSDSTVGLGYTVETELVELWGGDAECVDEVYSDSICPRSCSFVPGLVGRGVCAVALGSCAGGGVSGVVGAGMLGTARFCIRQAVSHEIITPRSR